MSGRGRDAAPRRDGGKVGTASEEANFYVWGRGMGVWGGYLLREE